MNERSASLTLLLILFSATAAASAEPNDISRLPRDSMDARSVKPPRARAANPCAEFGPGFARIDGSATCVKVGGSVGVETGSRLGSGR